MATAEQTVLRAYLELGAIDIDTTTATLRSALMSHGLDMLSRMINSWVADGVDVNIATAAITCTTAQYSKILTDMASTTAVAPGMQISGTGIPASTLVESIVTTTSLQMTNEATADGTVSLTFTQIPFDERFEDAVIALLAVRLSPSTRVPVSEALARFADNGWNQIQAAFVRAPVAQFDDALTSLSSTRHPSAF